MEPDQWIRATDAPWHKSACRVADSFTPIVFGFDLVEPQVIDLTRQNRCQDANEYQVPQAFLPVFRITRHSAVVYYQTR